jgi:GH18 family chitinase
LSAWSSVAGYYIIRKNQQVSAFDTEGGRQKFADSAVDLLKNLGFDGIDVDYEVRDIRQDHVPDEVVGVHRQTCPPGHQ